MGQTLKESGPSLAIELVDAPRAYRAGDIVLGKISRRLPIVSPRGWVTIKLTGRAKTKIKRRSGDSSTVYRGEYQLFSVPQPQEKIYDGPLHVPPEGEGVSWPFAIAIPDHANPTLVAAGQAQDHTNLSLKPEDLVRHPLPATFQCSQPSSWGSDYDGFVEYWIEATLHLEGRSLVAKATLPVQFRAPSTFTPVADLKLLQRSHKCTVATIRLIPGMENTELSFKQKARQFFGSSKVPFYRWETQIKVPTIIQLEHPEPIPLYVRVVHGLMPSSEIIRDVPQIITIESLNLSIKSMNEVVCPGNWTATAHTEDGHDHIDLGLIPVFNELKRQGPIVVPQGEDADFLNLGEHMELGLDANRVCALGRPVRKLSHTLYPTFTTYNIKQSYALRWEITFNVAGELYPVTGDSPLQILGPSEEREAEAMAAAGRQSSMAMQEMAPRYDNVDRDLIPKPGQGV
ncbi:hypothetical protein GQ53DRAFT_800702 [Thozetella sp. PMI_491]|nr:hypothetical protein GQ53DRAFT_800702 [Thozetella sp. PMI_491]